MGRGRGLRPAGCSTSLVLTSGSDTDDQRWLGGGHVRIAFIGMPSTSLLVKARQWARHSQRQRRVNLPVATATMRPQTGNVVRHWKRGHRHRPNAIFPLVGVLPLPARCLVSQRRGPRELAVLSCSPPSSSLYPFHFPSTAGFDLIHPALSGCIATLWQDIRRSHSRGPAATRPASHSPIPTLDQLAEERGTCLRM